MNELGRTGQRNTDQGYRAMASERGAWQPVGGRPAAPGPYAGPQQVGSQQVGPQQVGPQQVGPQQVGPGNPRVPGPRHPAGGPYVGPQQPQFGRPQSGRPQMGQPQVGQPQVGQPQFGRPGAPFAGAPAGPGGPVPLRPPLGEVPAAPVTDGPPAPRRRGRVGRWIAAGVVVAALGGVGWYVTFGAPAPVSAAVGDCVAQTGENDVKVVGCGEPSAQFKVAGKVEDKTMIAASLFACSDFPNATSSFWQGVEGKPGTVLCLAPLHP